MKRRVTKYQKGIPSEITFFTLMQHKWSFPDTKQYHGKIKLKILLQLVFFRLKA